MTANVSRVGVDALQRFIAAAYVAIGVPSEDAVIAASLMLESDLAGADGHGVFRLPQYIHRIKAGGMKVQPEMRVAQGGAAAALVDGDNGLGHLVMKLTAETAIAKAREAGIAWVGVRNGREDIRAPKALNKPI